MPGNQVKIGQHVSMHPQSLSGHCRQVCTAGVKGAGTRHSGRVPGASQLTALSGAVQLADFLGPHMQKAGGLVTLADVYCLFNRARGTELISPDDLLTAVNLFPAISTGMHLRTFASGVLVVQSNTHDDDEVRCSSAGAHLSTAADSTHCQGIFADRVPHLLRPLWRAHCPAIWTAADQCPGCWL